MAQCCRPITSSSCVWHAPRGRRTGEDRQHHKYLDSSEDSGHMVYWLSKKLHNSSCLPPYAVMEEPSKGSILPSHSTLPSTEKTQVGPYPAKDTPTGANFLNSIFSYGETLH